MIRRLKTHGLRLVFGLSLFITGLSSAAAQTSVAIQDPYSFSRDAGSVVVQYIRVPGELEAQNAETTITVYGNRRVLVEFPAFSPRAGTHQAWLSESEMNALVGGLVEADVMELNTDSLQEVPEAVPAQTQTGPYAIKHKRSYTADADIVRFTINLETYTRPSGAVTQNAKRRIRLQGLQGLEQQQSGNTAISRLAAVERQLIALTQSDRLEAQP